MTIELFPNIAPKTVQNFLDLSEKKFYDGTRFHRIIKDFMIQGGDPNSKNIKKFTEWGRGGSDKTISAEFNDISHKRGIVSMARNADPNSASSQFFIVHKDSIFLDNKYTAFGRLATSESFATLDKIAELETTGPQTNYLPTDLSQSIIQKVEVKNRSDVSNLLSLGEPDKMILPPVFETIQSYSDDDFGISFNTTSTWTIQKTAKHDPTRADIVLTGPKTNGVSPNILLFIRNSTSASLEEFSTETKKLYRESIDSGNLSILDEEKTTLNGKEILIRNSLGQYNTGSQILNMKYRETVFKVDGTFYTITYANTADNFDNSLSKYNQVLDSLVLPESKSGGCLIATAAFGTELAPQVQLLRETRDNVLFSTGSGTAFMTGFNEFYYVFSPTISDWERQSPLFKETIRYTLTPMLWTLSILQFTDIDSESKLLGYGIGIILLNVGIYFIVPTGIILRLKKFIR